MSIFEGPPVREDIWQGSDRLYICFGGILGGMGLSHFDFAKSANILDFSRIFVRDPYQAWYQRGLPAIGDNVYEVARFLEQRIEASGASEIRFVGNCMGGFAAILFCSLLRTGRAIAFAPQSFVSRDKLHAVGDVRALEYLENMYRHQTPDHIYDLRPWLERRTPDISADVYVCSNHENDFAHAKELDALSKVTVNYFEQGGHRVIVHLHQQGMLESILAA